VFVTAQEITPQCILVLISGSSAATLNTWTLAQAIEDRRAAGKVQRPRSVRLETTCLNVVKKVFGADRRPRGTPPLLSH
jgi:hypothetical protein